ncbi:BREX-1 system adenine-specific DNA-methyltransferase PglX [Holdemanella hominis]|uniref:site-specific DNA-methyltransferase (adenine-specific) n=1 Tax=Holdemanella hominis TaxID=2764327 RepID=A0ABR7KIY2_9FIRM|nr:BREX-1 system adenine-specific DNA-methyltransferase PglX [Holdemanella hominis]MBC6012387.1 BREX-1 system adenine-specific DNA-methyltransferase PglX [Holdemanella hominis]
MNKNAIKSYANYAHDQLVNQIKLKAFDYGFTESCTPELNVDSVKGKILSIEEKNQLNALIKEVKHHGLEHVVEEVAYTWFNRFIALRFMEVNNRLPQRIRVFTNENNEFKPEIKTEALHLDIPGLDQKVVFDLIEQNDDEKLYKYLLLTVCNDMTIYLPDMFTSIKNQDYKVLLFPDGLLKEDSVLAKMISDIPEEDWKDETDNPDGPTNAVTIIGWMYQYYISKRHNEVINLTKGQVSKNDIPAATELFTTDWVVRYMVDNSLGRYWIERNPDSELRSKLKFLATGKDGNLPIIDNDPIQPEELTFFDPCMGSGHILAYAFEVLMEIYRECGWSDRDAAISIVENNLYGLDIDERAYQLSYFSIMMQGCKYNRRFLKANVSNHLSNVVETNDLESLSYEGMIETEASKEMSNYLLHTFKDALELGSLIQVEQKDYDSYKQFVDEVHSTAEFSIYSLDWMENTYYQINKLIKQAEILSKKYCVTTTNPPYLNKMSGELKKYVVKKYKDYSSDLFAVFVKRNFDFTKENGYLGFMTPFVWMFIKSYEKLREYIINNKSIATLVQMEYSAYEEATVPICSFVLKNEHSNALGYYFRLSDFKGGMEVQKQKVLEAINNSNCDFYYEQKIDKFSNIPGSPVAFWVTDSIYSSFRNLKPLVELYDARSGLQTNDNNRFLKLWHEIDVTKFSFNREIERKWVPFLKGGEYRKWYGNMNYVVNWENDGKDIKDYAIALYKTPTRTMKSMDKYFLEGFSWSEVSSGKFSVRFTPKGFIFGDVAPTISSKNQSGKLPKSLLGFLNSKVAEQFLKILTPTIHFNCGLIQKLPIFNVNEENTTINLIVENCIKKSIYDWDSFETSWNFKTHPLVELRLAGASAWGDYDPSARISSAYKAWSMVCEERFNQLKANEEELNRIFIDIYGLQDELTPEVEDKDVTVRKADLVRDIKSFISYAVGCMFGRYSLDVEGLAYAGGEWDSSKYTTFIPDADDIIPICDEEYFEDDIESRFIEFVSVVYGSDTLEENLKFIADALGGKGTPREVLRNYFLNDFFKDHCNTYQVTGSGKRPIYWLFDSGKKNGFKALVYIHRYTPDLIARMRTGYIHPQQARYRTQIELLQEQIDMAGSTSEKVKLSKQLKKINEQLLELNKYEEIVHHWADKMEPMDLDDGIKVNYAKFQELLAKIK